MLTPIRTLTLPAPGKLNRMLRIVGRRADGYHNLQTVFQFINLCDWLTFTLRDDGRVSLSPTIPGVPDEANLIVRAAELLRRTYEIDSGVTIELGKNLPMGAGLGGGSSDAATTLMGLNLLWGLGIGQQELMRLGLALGADVPIFIFGRSAWGEGVGESLIPIKLPDQWVTLVIPDCHVSTRNIFEHPELTRDSPPMKMRDFNSYLGINDCLPVVLREHAEVAYAYGSLLGLAGNAALTGTGSCVYADVEDEQRARAIADALLRAGLNSIPVLGVEVSDCYKSLSDYSGIG